MASTTLAIEAEHLTKSYGRDRGIVDVNLTLARGEVLGLVGANGAGKTTLMRTLLDLIRPSSGSLRVLGLPLATHSVVVRRRSTYLPGEFVVPSRLTGHQALTRFAFTRTDMTAAAVAALANRLDLDLTRRVGDLSKGNRQKLALVLAFAPRAELLVLDEPTSGLDPILQRVFADLIGEAVKRGATVLLSSHVLSEVEQVADQVALMHEGSVAVVDRVSALLARSRRRGRVRPADPGDLEAIAAALRGLPHVGEVGQVPGSVTFVCTGTVDPILKALAAFAIDSLDLGHADLEDAFFVTEGAPGRAADTGGAP
jgi:ABC-2 type transport system ATP-binding protein